MTPSQLKAKVDATGSYFFTRNTLKFFGDSMSNYGVRSATITNSYGIQVNVWELWRKRAVKHGLKGSHYFDKVTFSKVR